MAFLDGIRWARGDSGEIERAVCRQIVQGDSRKADLTTEALIALRQQTLARCGERGIHGSAAASQRRGLSNGVQCVSQTAAGPALTGLCRRVQHLRRVV